MVKGIMPPVVLIARASTMNAMLSLVCMTHGFLAFGVFCAQERAPTPTIRASCTRDLKPPSLLLSGGIARLLDVGMAKIVPQAGMSGMSAGRKVSQIDDLDVSPLGATSTLLAYDPERRP